MKTFIISLVILATSLFSLGTASAVNVFTPCQSSTSAVAANTDVCNSVHSQTSTAGDPILRIIKDVITILSLIIGLASVIVIMIAGLTFITGGSDPQSVVRARNMILYAAVGIVVAILAESVVVFILKAVS